MNWGGFAGGLSQGFHSGVSMAKTFNDLSKERKVEEARAKGLAEMQAAKAAAIDGAIQENNGGTTNPAVNVGITGNPASAPVTIKPEDEDRPLTRRRVLAEQEPSTSTPSTPEMAASPGNTGLPFVVGGKGYATRDEARAAAEKVIPDDITLLRKTMVPQMQKVYIEQGNVEMADAWGKWAEDKENRANMQDWASAYKASIAKDYKAAKQHMANIHKRYDDGLDLVEDGDDEIKDKDGNIIGFKIKMKRKDSGEITEQVVNPSELVNYGLMALSPQALFETQWKRQQAADQAAAEEKAQIRKEQRGLQVDNYKAARDNIYTKGLRQLDNQFQTQRDARQQQDRIEMKTIESQLEAANSSSKVRREVGAKVDALRGAGYSDEFINGVLPSLLGVGEYKKAMSPEDAKLKIRGELMANDRAFQKMTEPERAAEVGRVMEFIYGKPGNTAAAPRSAAPSGSSYPPVWRQ